MEEDRDEFLPGSFVCGVFFFFCFGSVLFCWILFCFHIAAAELNIHDGGRDVSAFGEMRNGPVCECRSDKADDARLD